MIELQRFADERRYRTRIDEDGTKIIPGKFGHIFEYDDELLGVMVMPNPPKRNFWGYTRASLIENGFQVMQDGGGEGAATFDPANPKQVKLAIRAAGVKCRRTLAPEHKEKCVERLRSLPRRAGSGAGRAQS